jgi:hypothetical protein
MSASRDIENKFRDPLTRRIVAFLRGIGLSVQAGAVAGRTALPGIDISHGSLVVDERVMRHPGDLLHEAGHLAVVPAARRAVFHHDVGNDPGEEMAAIAWSYAAAMHLGIDPAIVFHDAGYRGSSAAILASFERTPPIGVPLLGWLGMTVPTERITSQGAPTFPHMTSWLCRREDFT